MPLREFTGPDGVHWKIWRVVPTARYAPPAVSEERRRTQLPGLANDRRRRLCLTPGLENGWLCFESEHQKRRLSPVPQDWETCTERVLADHLQRAAPVQRRRVEHALRPASGSVAGR